MPINTRRRGTAMLESHKEAFMSKCYLSVLCLAIVSAGAAAQPLPMNERGEIRWVCDGVGEGGREALAKMESGTNLKLVFAAGKRGAYLADVDVTLTDREGKRPALKFAAEGPICLIQAPAGHYHIEAAFRDVKRAIDTRVGKDAKQPAMLVFRFPDTN
jgi:hypothetical protein